MTNCKRRVVDLCFHYKLPFLVSCSEDNGCRVWDWEASLTSQLIPADTSKKLTFRACRLSGNSLVTLQVPRRKGASYISCFRMVKQGESFRFQLQKTQLASSRKCTTMCVGGDGVYIGVADALGDVHLFDQASLDLVGKVVGVHSLAVTSMSFAKVESPLLSSSANQARFTHIVTMSADKTVAMVTISSFNKGGYAMLCVKLVLFLLITLMSVLLAMLVAVQGLEAFEFGEDSFSGVLEQKRLVLVDAYM